MTKAERQRILNLPTIATWSNEYPGGIEVKDIEYGIDDYCLCVTQPSTDKPSVHRVKIHYNSDYSPYINIDGFRIYMGDCLRSDAI